MFIDARSKIFTPVRNQITVAVNPLYNLTNIPSKLWNTIHEQLSSRGELLAENERLKAEALLMEQRLQKLASLTEQNVRLRELLNSSTLVNERVSVSELIGVNPNPNVQRYLINKGSADGIFIGQAVLDATGIMGQVVEVMPHQAWVLLITDSTHSIPVMVNRNGVRSIASGTGENLLEIHDIPNNEDIQVKDLLVSSGLGGHFPAGYPVAIVTQVIRSDAPFLTVYARPTAALNRSRYVLLVFDRLLTEQAPNDVGDTSEDASTNQPNKNEGEKP